MKAIHVSAARKLLESGQPVDLRVWKSNGDILNYKDAICFSRYTQGDSYKIRLRQSGEIRQFPIVCLFEINDMEVYL